MSEKEFRYYAANLRYQRYDAAIGFLVGARFSLARAEGVLHTDIKISFGQREFLDMLEQIEKMVDELSIARREDAMILNSENE